MGSTGTGKVIEQQFKPSAEKLLKSEPVEIWDRRSDEPDYAVLANQEKKSCGQDHASEAARALNVYDQPIDLISLVEESVPREQSLYINGNPAVGENPNRNKQHGFYFNADNCIGCHACESACAEKNETPAHLAFRSVGYVEGGSYPDFQRLNISMACNHCDDPVCLKGCPTLAYTKHTEYGAVLQDPDTCFGCGYCTWVCPYNAPQLDPIEGQVSKCNMCVDRLEVGLKPSCVSACVGNALDFGVIEDIPENRQQAKTSIPGFPDPAISQPNIRFQQMKGLPEEMTRTDSAPLKYQLDQGSGQYKPALDPKTGHKKSWNLQRLYSRENPLVLFTLCTQAGIGAFVLPFIGALLGVDVMQSFVRSDWYIASPLAGFILAALGLVLSTTHLGKPLRFYRGFNNLRYSPVSREGLGVAIFMAFSALTLLLCLPANTTIVALTKTGLGLDIGALNGGVLTSIRNASGILATFGALGGLYYMVKCYLIPARPFWNHWQTASSFVGSALALGSLLSGAIAVLATATGSIDTSLSAVLRVFGLLLVAGLALELIGLYFHAKHNHGAAHEGAASHYIQTTTFGKTYRLRNCVISLALVLGIALLVSGEANQFILLGWLAIALAATGTALIGRAIFYVLVVPTTMPGAFFWRNKGFEQHARDIGLSNVVDMGVVPEAH